MAHPEVTGRSLPEHDAAAIAEAQARPRPPKLPHIARRAYRIVEFCAAHGVSRAKYYQLKKLGLAPHETDADGVILITEEDAAIWRRQRSAASRKPRITRKSA
jgi:hypothetical protein